MLETLVAVMITVMVLAVLVPLTLAWLLVRQIRRSRALRRLRAARRSAYRSPARTVAGGAAPLLRPWQRLAGDAQAARERFAATVEQMAAGPLRSRLTDVLREVDVAVADAQRLAREGSNTDRAHREVLGALARQRKRNRSAPAAGDLAHDLHASARAQQASADRLGEASRQTLCQLQLVIARLDELTATTLELTMGTSLPHQQLALSSIAEHVAALREATTEVEALDARVAL